MLLHFVEQTHAVDAVRALGPGPGGELEHPRSPFLPAAIARGEIRSADAAAGKNRRREPKYRGVYAIPPRVEPGRRQLRRMRQPRRTGKRGTEQGSEQLSSAPTMYVHAPKINGASLQLRKFLGSNILNYFCFGAVTKAGAIRGFLAADTIPWMSSYRSRKRAAAGPHP